MTNTAAPSATSDEPPWLPRFLTPAEVAQLVLQVPVSSVYDYARRKRDPLPHRRVGRHMRFVLAEVLEWVDRQMPSAA